MTIKEAYLLGFNAGYGLAKSEEEPIIITGKEKRKYNLRNGRKSRIIWTEEEDRIVMENSLNMSDVDLIKMLPGKTTQQLRNRRFKMGVKKPRNFRWKKLHESEPNYDGVANFGQKLNEQ